MEIMINNLNTVGTKIEHEQNESHDWPVECNRNNEAIRNHSATSAVLLLSGKSMMSDLDSEMFRRKRQAWTAFNSTGDLSNQIRDPDLSATIFNASVLAALCYATEAWHDKNATFSSMPWRFAKMSFEEKHTLGFRNLDLIDKSRLLTRYSI